MTAFSFDKSSDEAYNAQVLERLEIWQTIAGIVIQKFDEKASEEEHKGILRLNESLLFIAVKSVVDDIYKYKSYSKSETAESYKWAGYALKWLSKIRPIQIICESGRHIPKPAMQINGFYALFCAVSHLDIELKDFTEKKKLIEDMLYNTLYRNISGKSYALTFRLLEELVKAQKGTAPAS